MFAQLIHQTTNPIEIKFIARIQLLYTVHRQRVATLGEFQTKGE